MINAEAGNRLYNWKFEQAKECLGPEATDDERALVDALASMLGNPGYCRGHLATIVRAAVSTLIK